MVFAWDELNREHIAKHGVSLEEGGDSLCAARRARIRNRLKMTNFVVWGFPPNQEGIFK